MNCEANCKASYSQLMWDKNMGGYLSGLDMNTSVNLIVMCSIKENKKPVVSRSQPLPVQVMGGSGGMTVCHLFWITRH